MQEDKKLALVLGLGSSGLASIRHLARDGWTIRAADTRENPAGAEVIRKELPQVEIHTGGLPVALIEGVSLLVMSPGLSPDFGDAAPIVQAAREAGVDIAGEIELFARELLKLQREIGYEPVVIGITGTNGKTTTTSLTARMAARSGLRTVAAGNIGPNAVAELDRALEKKELPDVWVLELSSFQLATTKSLICRSAAVLNVTEDHLDWHGGIEPYAKAKEGIFHEGTVRILNREDERTLGMVRGESRTFGGNLPEKTGDYGLDKDEEGRVWLVCREESGIRRIFAEEKLLIVGRHNAMNALAALALIRAAGLSEEAALEELAEYRGEPHRVEKVLEADGVLFVDDSKGTNVGAVEAAVVGFAAQGKRLLIILGGDGKGQDFTPLAQALNGTAGAIAVIGQDAEKIADTLKSLPVPMQLCGTLEEAVDWLWTKRVKGDVLLLSPACASWDMFKNYAERSARFIEKAKCIAKEFEAC